jgi:hypothetical protein
VVAAVVAAEYLLHLHRFQLERLLVRQYLLLVETVALIQVRDQMEAQEVLVRPS